MARVVLGIDADVQGNLSAVEAMEEQLRVVRVAVCIARVRAALKVLALPETSVRCTWDVAAGWARFRAVLFDGRRVSRSFAGEGLGGLEALSHEVLQSARASRVKGIRAQAIVFHGWADDTASDAGAVGLPVDASNVIRDRS